MTNSDYPPMIPPRARAFFRRLFRRTSTWIGALVLSAAVAQEIGVMIWTACASAFVLVHLTRWAVWEDRLTKLDAAPPGADVDVFLDDVLGRGR